MRYRTHTHTHTHTFNDTDWKIFAAVDCTVFPVWLSQNEKFHFPSVKCAQSNMSVECIHSTVCLFRFHTSLARCLSHSPLLGRLLVHTLSPTHSRSPAPFSSNLIWTEARIRQTHNRIFFFFGRTAGEFYLDQNGKSTARFRQNIFVDGVTSRARYR